MLKIPGVKMLKEYTYSIGKSNNDSLLLTIIYRKKNNYGCDICKINVLDFRTDNRCGTIDLLEELIVQAMQDASNGKVIFTYEPIRMYIYMKTIINRKQKNIYQFTGQILKDNYIGRLKY